MRMIFLRLPALRLLLAALVSLPALSAAHPSLDARIAELSRRIAADPHDAGLLLERARAHRDHEDWLAARADVEAARALDAETPGLDVASADLALDEGRPEMALASADRAVALNARDADAWLLRAKALERLGRREDAAAAVGQAITSIDPPRRPQPDLYVRRARLLAAGPTPRTEEALSTLDAGLARLGPLVSLSLPAVALEISLARFDAARARVDALPLAITEKDRLRAQVDAAAKAAR